MCLDLQVAFASMFLLAFGLSAFGLGLFTTYFGAGKSRMIGVILTLIGIVVLLIFYLMTIDYFGYGWASDDVKDSFLGVLGITIGGILSFALVIILMMIIKEPEPEIPGIEDWEKELAAMDADKPGEGKKEATPSTKIPEGEDKDVEKPGEEHETGDDEGMEDARPEDEDSIDAPSDSNMSTYLKEKEEKKIVKEEWEKVDEEGNVTESGQADIPSEESTHEPEPPGDEGSAEESDSPEEAREEADSEPRPSLEDEELPDDPEESDEAKTDTEPEPYEDATDDVEEKKEGD